MPTPDLPLELWLEILSYLPRSSVPKMIGVNRMLFELAMDYLYEEIRLISDDKSNVKTFKQLSYKNIGPRARHLFIRPAFLPGIDEEDAPVEATHSRLFKSKRLASVFTYGKKASKEETENSLDPVFEILKAAKTSFKSCPNLRELTIILHDHSLTPSFQNFLSSLWASDSLGSKLLTLSIDTTVKKLPLLLNSLAKCSHSLTNLQNFDLTISVSRFPVTPADWKVTQESLVTFLVAFKTKLTSIGLSCSNIVGLSNLFENLPHLPCLRKFAFRAVFCVQNFPRSEPFTAFLKLHSATLETLIISPRSRPDSFHHPDDSYRLWLNSTVHGFPQLVFPNLKTFDVELMEKYETIMEPGLPGLNVVAPALKNLCIRCLSSTMLHYDGLKTIVSNLPRADGKIFLEDLQVNIGTITPEVFDLLAQNLVMLKSLSISYSNVSASYALDGTPFFSMFYTPMESRRYKEWTSLERLCLAQKPWTGCRFPHPDMSTMRVVAKTLPGDVVLVKEKICECL